MSQRVLVIGFTRNEGEYEGAKYNYCTVQTIGRMDGTKGTKVGYALIEYRTPPELWDELRGLPVVGSADGRPGVYYDVEIETVAGRRGASTQEVISIKPIAGASKGSAA